MPHRLCWSFSFFHLSLNYLINVAPRWAQIANKVFANTKRCWLVWSYFLFLFIYRHFGLIDDFDTCSRSLFSGPHALWPVVDSRQKKKFSFCTRAPKSRKGRKLSTESEEQCEAVDDLHRQAILILMAVLWLIVLRSRKEGKKRSNCWCILALKFCCALVDSSRLLINFASRLLVK